MSEQIQTDICVIGAGSGGLTVAAAAAAFGEKVVLLEKGAMGGDCLNYGCVPSKAMIAAGKHAHAMRQANRFGISSVEPRVDYKSVHDHIHGVIGSIAPNDSAERFEAMGVRVIRQAGHFTSPKTLQTADGSITITARNFVIATGSSPAIPPIEGIEGVLYLTNETLFDLTERPEYLVIIGGGPIGMELAQAQRRLGANVTVLEAQAALSKDDPELTAVALDQIRRDGVTIREGVRIARIDPPDDVTAHPHGARIVLASDTTDQTGKPEVIEATHLLVATGRKPNVKGLGLEEARIRFDERGITVKSNLRTSNRRVYAIGDVVGGLQFTHVASYHAGLVIRSILFGLRAKEDRSILPWVTYTDPELAHVGYNEEDARTQYKGVTILRWPYGENDRAQAERSTEGLIKIILNRKGVVMGVSIVGANAGELISMWALVVSQRMHIRAVTDYVAPYPTLSEIGRRAAITHYSDLPQRALIRRLISLRKLFR